MPTRTRPAALPHPEEIVRTRTREVRLMLAREEISVTDARSVPGEQIAGLHVHAGHTDAFYVLEGELTFEVGRETRTVVVPPHGLVAVPPHVAHAFRVTGDRPARWLTIHARDGGFAAFLRGTRDGDAVRWDIAAVPFDGGLPAHEAVVDLEDGHTRGARVRCALPDLRVVDVPLGGSHSLPRPSDARAHALFVIDGELELGGAAHAAGPGALVSVWPDMQIRAPRNARVLSLHAPG